MARPKKNQAHGAVNPDPVSVYDLLGYKNSPYKTNDVEEYRETISKMFPSDLHEHAIKVGVIPVEDRELLRNALVKAFIKFNNQFFKSMPNGNNKVTKQGLERAREILKKGK